MGFCVCVCMACFGWLLLWLCFFVSVCVVFFLWGLFGLGFFVLVGFFGFVFILHFLYRQNFLYNFHHLATVPRGLTPILELSLLSLSLQAILPGQCQLGLATCWPRAADRRCLASTDCPSPLPCLPGVRSSPRFWGCLHCSVAQCGQYIAAWSVLWAVR